VTLSPLACRIVFGVAVVLVLALSCSSFIGALYQIPDSETLGQQTQTWSQLVQGLLGVPLLVTAFLRRGPAIVLEGAWIVMLTAAGGLASVVWGGTSVGTGILGGVTTLLIGLTLVWLLRVGARRGANAPAPAAAGFEGSRPGTKES
jgi:hypothetical protein